jgi:hypothetical protein
MKIMRTVWEWFLLLCFLSIIPAIALYKSNPVYINIWVWSAFIILTTYGVFSLVGPIKELIMHKKNIPEKSIEDQIDHPTLRILFYIGLIAGGGLLLLASGDFSFWQKILFVAALAIPAWLIVKATWNFRNFDINTRHFSTRVASQFSSIYIALGCIIIFGTLIFIPWLVKGIRKDLGSIIGTRR